MVPVLCATIAEWQQVQAEWSASGIDGWGFVPTMGNLHAGHLSLVKAARAAHARVVVSIFVNPTQFEQADDFARYPRTFAEDVRALEGLADAVFCPEAAEIYSDRDCTSVTLSPLSDQLLGKTRPGHFQGVTTVVCKLLNIIAANSAYFGEKDYQQLFLIRRMVQDLFMPTRIVGRPSVREADGLAMSSRNGRLGKAERQAARVLSCALQVGQQARDDRARAGEVIAAVQQCLASQPLAREAQADLCLVDSLAPLERAQVVAEVSAVLLLSARFGGTLLIDQVVMPQAVM